MIELGVAEFQLVICAESVDLAQTSGRRKNQMIKKVFAASGFPETSAVEFWGLPTTFFLKKVGFSRKKVTFLLKLSSPINPNLLFEFWFFAHCVCVIANIFV